MCPCASSLMLWVLPYLMFDGSSPQSWMHSYLCSPSPRMGSFLPVLSSALIKNGVAAATALAVKKLRLVCLVGSVIVGVTPAYSSNWLIALRPPAIIAPSNQKESHVVAVA